MGNQALNSGAVVRDRARAWLWGERVLPIVREEERSSMARLGV